MSNTSTGEHNLSAVIDALRNGHSGALESALVILNEQLRALGRAFLRRRRGDLTLQATSLVNLAYIHLRDAQRWKNVQTWRDVIQVFAKTMRNKLRDHIKGRQADIRGGGRERVSLEAAEMQSARGARGTSPATQVGEAERQAMIVTAFDDALTELREMDERLYRAIALRFLCERNVAETAQELGVSDRSVEALTQRARIWITKLMNDTLEPVHDAGEIPPHR